MRRLKAAGAIVLGKTNMPEFATGANTNNALFGATRNPWNPALTPAGSSGGSAVAVATGMVPLAQGTDFGCSIRMPAAFCGIVGIRPTPGLTPNIPMGLAWDPGQVHGPLARDTEDVALMLDAIIGYSRLSPISVTPPWQSALAELERRKDARGLRIAYVSDIAGIGVEREIDGICREAALRVEPVRRAGRGNRIRRQRRAQRLPDLARLLDDRAILPALERARPIRTPISRAISRAGLKLTALDFAAAEQKRQETYHRFRTLFERFDVLLTPAAPVKPFPVEKNFPDRDQRPQLRQLHRLVRLLLSGHAGQLAGGERAGRPVGGRFACRHADRRSALRGADDPQRRPPPASGERRGLAADCRRGGREQMRRPRRAPI